jgi:hypothetical protein
MAIVSIEELKEGFEPGKPLRSQYLMNLVDTLADDRAAIHVGMTEPEDGSAVPLWFNDFSKTFFVYDGSEWLMVAKASPYSLPERDGLPGQVLSTDGNGNVTWKTL